MKKQSGQKSGERAVERWENEGGEILAIVLHNIKNEAVEKQRRDAITGLKRRILRNTSG